MRIWLVVIILALFRTSLVQGQTLSCTVAGYLFNADGSPAVGAAFTVINVVKNGSSLNLTPLVVTTDADGFTSFVVQRLSTMWISASALGLAEAGEVALLLPDGDFATLDELRTTARSPVAGFHLTSGPSPTLSISLEDFGIDLSVPPAAAATSVETFNGRSGAVDLTSGDISSALNFTPLDPGTVVGAVNASSATIDDRRLSSNMVRQDFANVFSWRQTLESGLRVTGAPGAAEAALVLEKGVGALSGLDIMMDGTGKAMRFLYPGFSGSRTYFNDSGMLYTQGWVVISGTSQGTGDTYLVEPPSQDPLMLGVWSDVGGPAVQVRGSLADASYLLSGMDAVGNYTFSVEQTGELRWGGSSRSAMDTSLYRDAVASLRTNGAFGIATSATIGGNATIGGRLAVSSGTLGIGAAQISSLTSGGLSTSGSFLVNGRLSIGGEDAQFYRQASGMIRTGGSLSVDGTAVISGPLILGAADSTLYRNAPSSIRTNSSVTVDGKLAIGRANPEYPLNVLGSESSAWNRAARFEAGANAEGAGATIEVSPPWSLFGAKLYGGRWSSADRGARLVGMSSVGAENAWIHVNGQSAAVTINTGGADRFTIDSRGNVGINTTPGDGTILDLNGGDSRGFRIAPRSLSGAPTAGAWKSGTLIVDSAGAVYVSVTSGSPGVWQRLSPAVTAPVAPAASGTRFLCISTQGVTTSSATPCSGT